ncbi:uncharacterized protein [Amphiura filiformis]|uniref:uncharacterized protein n=1 Tax=Amphiura filiformis TaxID=82378 RepID=UPI003B222076
MDNFVAWSSTGYPLYEIVSKFPLPVLAKLVAGTDTGSHALSGVIYRLKRLLRIHIITAQTMPLDGSTAEKLCIPKDYRGLFKILPLKDDMYQDICMEDIIQYQPRYIKVLERVDHITSAPWIKLNSGDMVEVVGIKTMARKSGVQKCLRLQNSTCTFVLNPDCRGKFQVIEDDTEYTLSDLVTRFPLPQRVTLVKQERHSHELLQFVYTSKENQMAPLLLKGQSQEEYIVGEELNGHNGIVAHVDANLRFHLPKVVVHSPRNPVKPKDSASLRMNSKSIDGDDDDDFILRVDYLICTEMDKLIFCKPRYQIFVDLALPRRPSALTQTATHLAPPMGLADEPIYVNIARILQKARDPVTSSVVGVHDRTLTPDRIGERLPMMTPEDMGAFMNPHARRPVSSSDDYASLSSDDDDDDYEDVDVPIQPTNEGEKEDNVTVRVEQQSFNLQINPNEYSQETSDSSLNNWTHTGEEEKEMEDVYEPDYANIDKLTEPTSSSITVVGDEDPDQSEAENMAIKQQSFDLEMDLKECKQQMSDTSPHDDNPDEQTAHVKTTDFLTSNCSISSSESPAKDLPDLVLNIHTIYPKDRRQLEKCTVEEVANILRTLLNLDDTVLQEFRYNSIDGELLCSLDENILKTDLKLSRLQINKLLRFIKGWRPNFGASQR